MSKAGVGFIASSPRSNLRIIDADSDYISVNAIKAVCQACPKLVFLNLRSDNFPHRRRKISGDEAVKVIVQSCPLIQVLPLDNWPLNDAAMDSLASIHTLTEFYLGDNVVHVMSSLAIQGVLQSNSNLVNIHLTGEFVDDSLVRCIGSHCRNLKKLHIELETFTFLTDPAFQDLFRGCPLLVNVELDLLEGVLSNTTLAAIFQCCRQLSILKLATNSSMIAVGGEYVLDSSYPSLTELRVNLDAVEDTALLSIFTHCNNLRHVSLADCDLVTDAAIKVLAHCCPLLDNLRIETCSMVTIAGTLEVAAQCTRLTHLSLISQQINDELLTQLSLNCISLNTLMLQIYDGVVTEVGMAAVADRCKHLKTFLLTASGFGRETEMLLILECMNAKTLYRHIKFIVR